MLLAWLLTALALCGIAAGTLLGQSGKLSAHAGAAGGGLLFGIALFWLVPEIAQMSGWAASAALALAAAGSLGLLDKLLIHSGHSPRQGVIAPVLAATAVHSFLDGWSVRALMGTPLAGIAVPLGLGLHKIPEGAAIGWLTRRNISPAWRAFTLSALVELATIVGALVEPGANRSGIAAFGAWWTAVVLAIIAGSFLFLGFHAVLPERRNVGVMAIFVIAFLITGGTAMFRY